MPDSPYVFVSYASPDRERVLPVVERLEAAGVNTWIDREGIHGGANYALEIAEAIEHAAALLLMCSESSLASRNVKQELALAWRFEKPYLPLLLDPVEIPKDVAYWLEGAQWIELLARPAPDWLRDVAEAVARYDIDVRLESPSPATTPMTRERPLLVGREREQGVLRDHLDRMLAGRGGTVLVGGEAGIGKTTLVEDLCIDAEERGCLVLWGHAYDLSVTPPYGPWLEIWRQYRHTAVGLPSLPPFLFDADELTKVGSQETLFTEVAEFLNLVASQRPIVLVLDDLHWFDQASLDFTRFLARQAGSQRLLLVSTYRSDELHRRHPLYTLLPLLVREAGAARMDVQALTGTGYHALIASRYLLSVEDQERLEQYLEERAEGNPLYAWELLNTLEEEHVLARQGDGWVLGDLERARVPLLLRQVIEGRVARLPEESQQLLGVAAVIGQAVPLAIWAAVGEVAEDDLLEMAEHAAEARLLDEDASGSGVRFHHALIHEALYEGIPSLRRRRLHGRVADVLMGSPAPDPDMVAYHLQQARDARAADWLFKAGERARRAYAWADAADRFEAALARMTEHGAPASERAVLLVRAALVQRYLDARKALALLIGAQQLAGEAGEVGLANLLRVQTGLLRCFQGDVRQGLIDMQEALTSLRSISDEEQSRLGAMIGGSTGQAPEGPFVLWLTAAGRLRESIAYGDSMLAQEPPDQLEVGQGGSSYADGLQGIGLAQALLGQPSAARNTVRRARAVYQAIEHHNLIASITRFELELVQLTYFPEELEARAELARIGEEAALRAAGAMPTTMPVRYVTLSLLALECAWEDARDAATVMYGTTQQAWQFRMYGGYWLAWLARQQGDVHLTWQITADLLPEGPQTEPGNTYITAALTLQRLAADIAIETHDFPTAQAWLEAHDRWLDWSGAVLGRAEGALLWAQYHHANGDSLTARELVEQALAHASDPRQPLALIAVHRFLGQIDTEDAQFDSAEQHLQQSRGLAEACQAPFERALALLELARLRLAQGKPEQARTLLAEVRAICEPLGAKPTLERVATLAAALAAE